MYFFKQFLNTTVNVLGESTPGTIGSNQSVCAGIVPQPITSLIAPTGSGVLSYMWEKFTTGDADWSVVAGATSETYTPGALTTTTRYRRTTVSTNGTVICNSDASNEVVITVNAIPTITSTTPGSRCDAGTVTLSAIPSAGTVNWYSAATGGTLLGTGNSFTTPSLNSTTTYYVDATSNGCTTASRTAVVATINPIPVVSITSVGSICADVTSVNLYGSPAGGTFSGTGVTGNTFQPIVAGAGSHVITYTYTNSFGCTASSTTTITVLASASSLAIAPATQTICPGQSASFTASGNNGGTVNWTANMLLPSGTGVSYNTGTLQNKGTSPYDVEVTATVQTGGCVAKASATVTVLPDPRVIIVPASAIVCYYEIPHFTLTSVIPGTTINWQLINNTTSAVVTSGSGMDIVTLFGTTFATGTYSLKVSGTKDGCTSTVTNVPLTVN